MKLWIIYKEGFGFSKMIAEMLQDRLEDYIDVSVGSAKKIDPTFLVEESLGYLIIGDIIGETIPSLEIQKWLHKYREVSKNENLVIKATSGFYIASIEIKIEPFWNEFLNENINAEIRYPPILCLKLNRAELVLEDGALEIIKDYSNNFIKFFIENKKENKKDNRRKDTNY